MIETTHTTPDDALAVVEAMLTCLPVDARETVLAAVERYGDVRADDAWTYATR